MKKIQTKKMAEVGLFAALLAVLAQIAIPLPAGVPFTLQTFGVALLGMVLGRRWGSISFLLYFGMGCIGVPVFANLQGGLGVLFGKTGGFLIGFFILVILCGTKTKNKWQKILLGLIGLAGVYLCGAMQLSYLTGMSIVQAFVIAGLPYLWKDVLSIWAAYLVGGQMKNHLDRRERMD